MAVTAGRWQRNGIAQARRLGLKVVAIDADPQAEGFADADRVLNVGLDEHEIVLRELRAMGIAIRGAVSFASDAGTPLAASIRKAFDLPGPRPELAERLLNKARQRTIWADQGVPGPSWRVFNDPEQALAAMPTFGFPLIIKPADSSGSRGVAKIESPADDLRQAVARAFEFSKSSEVLIESYMDGTEFTVETFAAGGPHRVLAVTEKKKVEGTRGTVASELATPQRAPEVVDRIAQAVVSAYAALGYDCGPGHAEVILQKDGQVGLVEVAGRGGGFMVFDKLVPAVSGVDVARLTVLQAVGREVGVIRPQAGAAVLRFMPSRPGFLKSITGFDEANRIEGVEAGAFVKAGIPLHQAAADGDRLGYILSRAATAQRAQELADEAERFVHFDIDSSP